MSVLKLMRRKPMSDSPDNVVGSAAAATCCTGRPRAEARQMAGGPPQTILDEDAESEPKTGARPKGSRSTNPNPNRRESTAAKSRRWPGSQESAGGARDATTVNLFSTCLELMGWGR